MLNGLTTMSELEHLSINDVDAACRALDAWQSAVPDAPAVPKPSRGRS